MAFKRVLIAIDTSEVAIQATRVGLELAAALGAEIAFVHVITPVLSDGAWIAVASPELSERPDDAIVRVLASLRGRAPIPAKTVKFAPVGAPVESITQAARDWSADLVVVGGHGREGADRVRLGGVAQGVARRAPCPVLVVRAG